jgi:hypothetical protein
MKRSTPMKRTAFKPKVASIPGLLRTARLPAVPAKAPKRMRTKQRPVTAEEKLLWDRMANEVGCIACRHDGRYNIHVSIHHIDGRTKPGCHKKVLPLCAGHHQDGTGRDPTLIAVHPYKTRFEERYGSQDALLGEVMNKLGAGQ